MTFDREAVRERHSSILWDTERVKFSYTSTEPVRILLEKDLPAALDEIDRLEKWARAIGYDLSAVEECQRIHSQNCTACPRLECCDNQSPIHAYGVKLKRLEGECEKWTGLLRELEDAIQDSVRQGYTHQWTYRMQCAIEAARAALDGRD